MFNGAATGPLPLEQTRLRSMISPSATVTKPSTINVNIHAEANTTEDFKVMDGYTSVTTVTKCRSPSWLALNDDSSILLATNEVDDYNESQAGSISSYRIDPDTGLLSFISIVSSQGKSPTHLEVGRLDGSEDEVVYVSNYSSGSLSVHRLDREGFLSESIQTLVHDGSTSCTNGAHVHQSALTGESSLTVVDLGIDRVKQYMIDRRSGLLITPFRIATTVFPNLAGPRHIAIHPTRSVAFVMNELASSITALHFDRKTGQLKRFDRLDRNSDSFRLSLEREDPHTWSTLPPGASNRGFQLSVATS